MTFATTGSNLQIMMTELLQGNLPSPPPSPFILADTPNGATAEVDFNGFVLNTLDNSQTPVTGLFSATFSTFTVAELLASISAGTPVNTPFSGTLSLTTIPEPGSLLLMGVGLLGAGLLARRKARS
jgi:hypothetical protein